jgi:hypothetical protein
MTFEKERNKIKKFDKQYVCQLTFGQILTLPDATVKMIAGMITGVVGGCVCGITAWLVYASQFEGGLAPQHFINNTGKVTFCQL